VQHLPFATGYFDSVIMTFPPSFASDVHAMSELRRVLADDGRLIWVDAAYLYPRDAWSRFLNWAFRAIDGVTPLPRVGESLVSSDESNGHVAAHRIEQDLFSGDDWTWRVERIERPKGYTHVMTRECTKW
jgi:SAM-dependent methyltransferase